MNPQLLSRYSVNDRMVLAGPAFISTQQIVVAYLEDSEVHWQGEPRQELTIARADLEVRFAAARWRCDDP